MNPTGTPARPSLPHAYPRGRVYATLRGDPLHAAMRRFDDEFLRNNADGLRDYAAHWVADPLRHWSRRWEYPFVFERVSAWARQRAGGTRGGGAADALATGARESTSAPAPSRLRVLDAGSGLTFFPHFLASELAVERVDCTDRDPAMERDARRLRPPASPAVSYSTQDLAALGFADASFDCTYCISVLEHTAERARIVDEFFRTLRPGGLLVVTIDVSLDGRAEIPREEAAELMGALERRFAPLEPYGSEIAQAPGDVVTTRNVGRYEPSLVPPRTYATAGGVIRRLLRPRTFPWGRAFRRLVGAGGGGSASSDLTFFCTAWLKPAGDAPPVGA